MNAQASAPRVVIVGAGFAGLHAARGLRNAPVRVTVIDRTNHHLFQPLLYQVATASLSPADISAPIRGVLGKQANTEVLLGEVTGVDVEGRRVLLDEQEVPFDYLVLATGVQHNYFGHDEWRQYAIGLKTLQDATVIQRKILLAFEEAEREQDAERRQALLTFVVVGAGPAGVEMTGAVAELAHKALASDFRHIDPKQARVLLVEAGPRILPTFPESLAKKARRNSLGWALRCEQTAPSVLPMSMGSRLGACNLPRRPSSGWPVCEALPPGCGLGRRRMPLAVSKCAKI